MKAMKMVLMAALLSTVCASAFARGGCGSFGSIMICEGGSTTGHLTKGGYGSGGGVMEGGSTSGHLSKGGCGSGGGITMA